MTLKDETRRYKRALLQVDGAGVLHEIASARAEFAGGDFAVVDLSHTGIAILKAGTQPSVAVGAIEPMTLTLGLQPPFRLDVLLNRSSERVLAFEFAKVSTEARMAIDRFLDPKMIGLNMRAVDRNYFAAGETFSLWLCGPRDTNFFLWMSGPKLERALIQLGDEQYTLDGPTGSTVLSRMENGVKTSSPTPGGLPLRDVVLFALDVALQVTQVTQVTDTKTSEAVSALVKGLTEAAATA